MVQGLGSRLQEQRLKMKLSQKQAANLIDVSPSLISNYEASERTPSLENLLSLAALYHCSTDYLLGIDKIPMKSIDVSMLDDKQLFLLQQFLDSLSG